MYVKEIIGAIAVVMAFVAYIPYYKDILKGKTHPHIYSWSLWGFLTILILALQIKGGAGPAAWMTAAVGLLCLGVVVLSFRQGKKDITTTDTVTAILSLTAIGFWLFANQPIVAIFLAVAADMLAFFPTVRKSWNQPHTETLSLYATNAVRFLLVLLAIEQYTILTVLWPVAWAIGNGLFAIMLIVRRKYKS